MMPAGAITVREDLGIMIMGTMSPITPAPTRDADRGTAR
jgi:hypothetical protein